MNFDPKLFTEVIHTILTALLVIQGQQKVPPELRAKMSTAPEELLEQLSLLCSTPEYLLFVKTAHWLCQGFFSQFAELRTSVVDNFVARRQSDSMRFWNRTINGGVGAHFPDLKEHCRSKIMDDLPDLKKTYCNLVDQSSIIERILKEGKVDKIAELQDAFTAFENYVNALLRQLDRLLKTEIGKLEKLTIQIEQQLKDLRIKTP